MYIFILDMFYIINIAENFKLIIPSVLNILIYVYNLPYFSENGGQRKFKLQQLLMFPYEYQAYSKFNATLI